ncbi:MAG: hypothetical protein AAGG01_03180 [Planctomycetota bacterium]
MVPVLLALAVMGLAYLGLQKIVSNTGPWALQAADKALADSGLPTEQTAPFSLEVARLRTAYDAESLDSTEVVNGVAGLLETPILPLLILNDAVERRLPSSGLDEAQRAEFLEATAEFSRFADAQRVPYQGLIQVLGPLARTEEEGGPVDTLTDDDFVAMAARARTSVQEIRDAAKAKNESLDEGQLPADVPDIGILLARYRDHVDAVLAGSAPTIERSR